MDRPTPNRMVARGPHLLTLPGRFLLCSLCPMISIGTQPLQLLRTLLEPPTMEHCHHRQSNHTIIIIFKAITIKAIYTKQCRK